MVQYLLNMTAIWLLSLAIFDIFLRRETYHGYNRLYLTISLLLGALLPLWSWQPDSFIHGSQISERVVERSAGIKETIATSATPQSVTYEQWLWYIYLAGVIVFMLYMLREMLVIINLYRKGKKSKHGRWTVIETGKPVGPFSAFNYIFISGKENYSAEELTMIMAHEEQHVRLKHYADILVARTATILFWFHPLVYLFEKRIRMVHEYQADSAIKNDTAEYGRFLLEQSVLGTAPVLSYSFAYSPIKNRIIMLTKRSRFIAKTKQIIILPVVLVCSLCFTQNAFSGDNPQNDGLTMTYKGNVFKREYFSDTVMVEDPKTGEIKMVIARGPLVTVNGDRILYYDERSIPDAVIPMRDKVREKTIEALEKVKDKLPKGHYAIDVHNIIVDKHSNIVYCEPGQLKPMQQSSWGNNADNPIRQHLQTEIKEVVRLLVESVPAAPLFINGTPTPYSFNIYTDFTVE